MLIVTFFKDATWVVLLETAGDVYYPETHTLK